VRSSTSVPPAVALTCAALLCWAPLRGAVAFVARDPNEGWNALLATRALHGLPLYFAGDSLVRNNYPPLSFELIATLSRALGGVDVLFLGRGVAFVSLVGSALAVLALARAFGASLAAACFGAAFLLADIGANHKGYVAMNDPQWLGHAVQLSGVVLLVRARSSSTEAAGAALVVLALSIKHTLVAAPLALVYRMLADARQRTRPVLLGALVGVALTSLLWARHMPLLLDNLALSRQYFLLDALRSGATQALYLAPPALAWWLTRRRTQSTRSGRQFAAAYCSIGFSLGAVMLGGAGVDTNVMFDAVIAAALGAALSMDALPRLAPRLAVLSVVLLATPLTLRTQWEQRAAIARERILTERTVELLRTLPSPALCWNPALCHWAGQSFEFDAFGTRQRQARGALPRETLERALAEARFGAIQLPGPGVLSGAERAALGKRYRQHERADLLGSVFVRSDWPERPAGRADRTTDQRKREMGW
jgi:hypothetical protein